MVCIWSVFQTFLYGLAVSSPNVIPFLDYWQYTAATANFHEHILGKDGNWEVHNRVSNLQAISMENGYFLFYWDYIEQKDRQMVMTNNKGSRLFFGKMGCSDIEGDNWMDPNEWTYTNRLYSISNFIGYPSDLKGI